jgi:CheY-like chemotaxis protein
VQAASKGAGLGAEFTIRLPLQEEPAALSQKPMMPARPASEPLHVLVVEDSQDAANSLRMVLEMLGHKVTVVYTGPDGVAAASRCRPDVVLCDIGLPGMNGYEVAGELRKNPATARCQLIALTGYGREEDRRRSRQAGFDHHLTKPVDPHDLQPLLICSA